MRPVIVLPLVGVVVVAGLGYGGLRCWRHDVPVADTAKSTDAAKLADTAKSAKLAGATSSIAGGYAAALPAFTLEDPAGKKHERDALLADGGLVVVVTAPTLACGEAQEAWNEALAAAAPGEGRWLLLEDLSQSAFPGTALGRMKDEFDPARSPLLLLDPDGALRKSLGVAEDATVVLVYDEEGALTHAQAGEASESGAEGAWAALAGAE